MCEDLIHYANATFSKDSCVPLRGLAFISVFHAYETGAKDAVYPIRIRNNNKCVVL